VVGPAKDFECTHKQARKILVGLQQPEIRAFDLLPWLNAIPRCTMRRFSEVLLFMDYLLNNSKDQTAVHIAYHPGPVPVKVKETSFIFMEHFNDIMEKKLVLCIEYGKVDEIEKLLNDLLSQTENMPNITPDPERAFKNIFIFCIGVASRAALKGGLDYDTVIEASDQYIRRIELVNGYASISSLLRQMFMDYTQRIARSNSLIKTTSIVKKIDKEISSYLYKKITPTVISRNLGINCSYLCRLFKAETGKTISTYINEVKINASKYLLKSTDLPVVEISEDLGYSSENYFYKVFKEITSMTPVEYRNSGS
jgi:YesN/AraC family two-component response regulator